MVMGYDRRQPARDTFAFQPAAASRQQPRASGQSRGAQLVGGQSVGGVVSAGPLTDAGPVASGLGQFVAQTMEPHVRRRQLEAMYRGAADAQSGMAVDEISKSSAGLSKIFGPTAYEEGAHLYAAQQAVNQHVIDSEADVDLPKLPTSELAKVMSDRAESLMTGNPFMDAVIQQSLFEHTGPLMASIAKKRMVWQQTEARGNLTGAWNSGADGLQTMARSFAATSDPTDAQRSGLDQAVQNFRGSMVKPEGMTDETYRGALYDFTRHAMQKGNFVAVNALRAAGLDGVLSDEQVIRLEDASHRYGERTQEDFLATDPGIRQQMLDYEDARAKGALAPLDAANRMAVMNAYIRAHTGVDDDYYDWKQTRGEVRSLAEMNVANWRRAQDRQWQIEDREYAAGLKAAERAQDEAETAAAVGAAWATGDVNGAVVGGVPSKHFERRALTEYRQGNLDGLTRAFVWAHSVFNGVKQDIAGSVAGSLDQQYGKSTEAAHRKWQAMYKANPGMAAAYYGDWHPKMQAFDTLARQVGPTQAYVQAFGDSARYSNRTIRDSSRQAAIQAIDANINSRQPGWYNPFSQTLDRDAVIVIRNAAQEDVALALQNSDVRPEVVAPERISALIASGAVQLAGGKAWRAARGTKPFAAMIGVQQDEADAVFRDVVDARLKAVGFAPGVAGDLSMQYINAPNGKPMLSIVARSAGQESRKATISIDIFKAEVTRRVAANQPGQVQRDAKQAAQQRLDPRRRIAGESGWQRLRRINLENAARGIPKAK